MLIGGNRYFPFVPIAYSLMWKSVLFWCGYACLNPVEKTVYKDSFVFHTLSTEKKDKLIPKFLYRTSDSRLFHSTNTPYNNNFYQ